MIIGEEYKPFNLFFGAVMPNWLMKRTEINGNDKMIFSRLCQYAGKNGKAFPKRETLAEEVGLKENTVRKILIKLENNGLIKIKPKKNGIPTEYIFTWHEWINTGFKDEDLKIDMKNHENGDNHPRNNMKMGITIPENHENGDNHPQNNSCKQASRLTGKGLKRNEEPPKRINSLRESKNTAKADAKASPQSKEVPKDSKLDMTKPCNKYNYTYVGNMKDSSTYIDKLNQTKRSYIAMLERDYGKVMHKTYSDNVVNGKKEKFFIALTTFLLEWDKQTPNRVKTYRDLVKCYYRRVFFNANEESAHSFYREKIPNPNQLITENAIDVWHQFWDRNPMLVIKPKEVSKAVKIQQAKEIEKFGRHFEDLCTHLFDNSYELATGGQEKRNEFFDLKELKVKMREFRKESGAV